MMEAHLDQQSVEAGHNGPGALLIEGSIDFIMCILTNIHHSGTDEFHLDQQSKENAAHTEAQERLPHPPLVGKDFSSIPR